MTSARTRVLIGVVGIALLAGLIGWIAGRQVKSPAQVAADAEPPPASLITVPVEERILSRDIETTVDASYGETEIFQVAADETSMGDRVVTGRVPEQGEELVEGAVAIEVSGRPTFLLDGEIPTFRTMRPGDSGIDVAQLEEALARLGFLSSGADSFYNEATEEAVRAMYQDAGYAPPAVPEFDQARLEMAENAVDEAEEQVFNAQDAVDLSPEPTSQQRRALERAKNNLTKAQDDLATARAEVGTPLPQSEVAFFPNLPRVVTEVLVESGDLVTGPVMSVSGGAFRFTGSLPESTRFDVELGVEAVVKDEGTGTTIPVTISELARDPGTDGVSNSRYFFAARPVEEVDAEALARIGVFSIVVPLEQSDGEVLVVPKAAIEPGSDVVEVETSDGSVETVRIHTGLEANEDVEVTPARDGELKAGDRVVVKDRS